MKISEESSRIIHHRAVRIGTDDPNRPVSFMLETLAGRFSLLFLWRLSSTWWSNNKKDQSKIPSFDCTLLSCSNKSIRGKKHGETQWQQDHGKVTNAKRRAKRHGKDTITIWWQQERSTEILSEPMDGRKNIADTWTTSRRSTSLTPHPGIRSTGTRAPTRWQATMRIVKLDQWKQEEISDPLRKFSQISDKNKDDRIPLFRRTRARQRLLDEELRAELERICQNWRTYFSQPSSSSWSSQNWWQHEHQDSQWREHQDTQWQDHQYHTWWFRRLFQGVSLTGNRDSLASDGVCGQNTSSHAHFSQSWRVAHVWAHLTVTRTCVWPKIKMFTGVVLSLCALKSHPISQHVSQDTSRRTWPSHRFGPRLHRRHPLHDLWLESGVPPVPLRVEGRQSGCLAEPLPNTSVITSIIFSFLFFWKSWKFRWFSLRVKRTGRLLRLLKMKVCCWASIFLVGGTSSSFHPSLVGGPPSHRRGSASSFFTVVDRTPRRTHIFLSLDMSRMSEHI